MTQAKINKNVNNNYDVIVVGAGVAGASLSIALARDGRRVLCLERALFNTNTSNPSPKDSGETSPPVADSPPKEDRELYEVSGFQGEYLQPAGVAALAELGLSDALLGIGAVTGHGMTMTRGLDTVVLSYAEIPGNESSPITHTSRVFRHGRFVRNLRTLALAEPNLHLEHAVVTRTVHGKGPGNAYSQWTDKKNKSPVRRVVGVAYNRIGHDGKKAADESIATAPITVICDGIGGFLPHSAAHVRPKKEPAVNAYALELPYNVPSPAFGHIIVQDAASVMLYPLETSAMRCIVLYPPGTDKASSLVHMSSNVKQYLPRDLQAPFAQAVGAARPLKQTSNVRAEPGSLPDDGVVVVGDSLKARNAFTGAGMTIALHDVVLVRDMLRSKSSKSGGSGGTVGLTRNMNCNLRSVRARRTTPVDFLANSMYQIFGRGDPDRDTAEEKELAKLVGADRSVAGEVMRAGKRSTGVSDMRDAAFAYLASDKKTGSEMFALMSGLCPSRVMLLMHLGLMAMFMFGFFAWGRNSHGYPSPYGAFRGLRAVATLLMLTTPTLMAERFTPRLRFL